MIPKARKVYFVLAGLLGLVFGARLMLDPVGFAAGEAMSIDAKVGTIAQAHGAGVVAFSVLLFLAVRVTDPDGLLAILGGNIALQLLSIVVNVYAVTNGLIGSNGWGAVGMHTVLLTLYAFFLATRRVAQTPLES